METPNGRMWTIAPRRRWVFTICRDIRYSAAMHFSASFKFENFISISSPVTFRYDGEFWMEFFDDFCKEFEVFSKYKPYFASISTPKINVQEVSICTLGPDFDHDGKVDEAKCMKIAFGQVTPAEMISMIMIMKLQQQKN